MIKLSEFVAKYLKEKYGVKDMFLITGGGAMHLNDSFGQQMKYICNHNEQASAIAAEGFARYKEQLAVVNVTTGPGGLNTLNGVFGAWTDSAPVLFISGQVKMATTMASCPKIPLRQLGDQEVDIVSVVKPLTKYAVMVRKPEEIKYHLDKAVYEATHGRFGPVWLDIPINVQAAMIDENKLKEFIAPREKKPALEAKVRKVIAKLAAAKAPLIVAGHGIRLAGELEDFYKLLQKIDVPVVTTFNGFDIMPTKSRNFIGRIGTVGQRAGNFALQNADVILFLGTRNNIRQVSYNWENFAPSAYKIAVDIDKAELEKPIFKADMAINADLHDFLPLLLRESPVIRAEKWLEWCGQRKAKYAPTLNPDYQQKGSKSKINVYHFLMRLTALMKEGEVLVAANGSACVCMHQAAEVKKNQRIFWNSGDASMGYALPAAIGASVAAGRGKTVCLEGDGSLMMNLQELATIAHDKLPVILFIINNDGYISIKQTQNNFFKGRDCGTCGKNGVGIPDFLALGKAFGIKTVRVENPDKLDSAIKDALASDLPYICEVMVDPDYIFTPKLSSRTLPDGSMVSPSLEDMYPFLPEGEMKGNVYKP